jgi:hypothetical protein
MGRSGLGEFSISAVDESLSNDVIVIVRRNHLIIVRNGGQRLHLISLLGLVDLRKFRKLEL